ncbi:MAG: FtsW/RodA/SpoVE family cell cycle protein [Clostridia bacterium]
MTSKTKRRAIGLLVLLILFIMCAFSLLAFSGKSIDYVAPLFGAILSCVLIIEYALMARLFGNFDRFLLITVDILLCIGMATQYRMDSAYAFKQLAMFVGGSILMFICIPFFKKQDIIKKLTLPMMIASIIVLGVLLVFGKENGGAKNWINIAGFTFQPSEFVKIATVIVLAFYFDKSSRFKKVFPAFAFVLIIAALLMLERDLGAVMLIAGTALIVFYAATGNILATLGGVAFGAGGALLSYSLFDHVRIRVAVWQNPWATYEGSGYQIAQGLMAIASGGLFGVGLGMGTPKIIPAYRTDYIFAVICEQFGIIVGLCVIAFYIVFIIRGINIALKAPNRFLMLLGFGCTVLITLQSFIIIGGVIKMIPLTGITLPFVSYGGTSMIACMILLGILQSIAVQGREELTLDENKTQD